MKIALVTPAAADSTRGNGVTARRWAWILQDLGHSVQIWRSLGDAPPSADLLIALHARKSAGAIQAWRRHRPGQPLVLALTGTDLYGDLPADPVAQASVAAADRIVVLQERARERLSGLPADRIHVIYQSVPRPPTPRPDRGDKPGCRLCVLAHLRRVKDPLRAVEALRLLPADFDLQVTIAGSVIEPEFGELLAAATADARVHYVGELVEADAADLLRTSDGLVVSSRMEGGANVVGEAIVGGVPVLASRIDGNIGLLGEDYGGYFPVGDAPGLAALMRRFATEPAFVARLVAQIEGRQHLFDPARESAAWRDLLAGLR